MPFNPQQTIADKTPFTPAERAVIVERAEGLKVELDTFIKQVKDGTPQDMVTAIIPAARYWEGIESMIRSKLVQTIHDEYFDGFENL